MIFDFDGTLAHTLDDVVLCMNETFAAFGEIPPSTEEVQATMGMPLEAAFAALRGRDADQDETTCWVHRYRSTYARYKGERTTLFPGVRESLSRLGDEGIHSIVVSNKGRDAIEAALARLGIAKSVKGVFAADTVRFKKPDLRLYTEEIKRGLPEVADAQVLVVGDSESDVRFARNSNLTSCWAAYGYGNQQACLRLKPDIIIHRFEELALMLCER